MNKQEKISKVMKEFKEGTLKTSAGKKVKSRKQAVAIAMSESKRYAEKADLISQINISSLQEAEEILKAAGEEELFEKAKHQDGDMHPNGKWVWVSSANGGKGDWRTKGGRTHTKHSAGGGNAGALNTTQQKPSTQVASKRFVLPNLKQVFSDIRVLNPSTSTVSSLGTFVSSLNQQISDNKRNEIKDYLPKDSTAYKIISSNTDNFSDKQLWVISYELMNNQDYLKDLNQRIEETKQEEQYQKSKKSAKRKLKSEKKKKEEQKNAKEYDKISSDDKVKHPVFGEGKVLFKTDDKITVFFKTVGEKKLLIKFAKLEKI